MMKVNTLMAQMQKVRAGKGDFAALLDMLHAQTSVQQKVVPLTAVKRARQLNQRLSQLT